MRGRERPPRSPPVPSQPERLRVLIVAGDPMVAALLGMLLDPARHEPVYPQPGERPEDAVARLRPPLAILLDCDLEEARSDLFLARAERARAALLFFTPPAGSDVTRTLAAERGVPCIALPVDRAALTRILDDSLRRAGSLGLVAVAMGGGVLAAASSMIRAW